VLSFETTYLSVAAVKTRAINIVGSISAKGHCRADDDVDESLKASHFK